MKKVIKALFVVAAAFIVIGIIRSTIQVKPSGLSGAKEIVRTVTNVEAATNEAETFQTKQIPAVEPKSLSYDDKVRITYIDVGQGDSTLISLDGYNMLIDTGTYEAYDNVQSTLSESGVNSIDTLVLTHPDADHIQNADEIIRDYNVGEVLLTNTEKDTKSYQDLNKAIEQYDVPTAYPTAGREFSVGNAYFTILGPKQDAIYEDTNSYSIIIKMVYGNTSFLFLGDATGEEIEDIPKADFTANVYKAAHHGSANCGCNSSSLLSAVSPEYMVISCAYQNDYGHPHRETMQLAKEYNLKLYRTDLQGSVTCVSDGNTLAWSDEPSSNYICGSDE